MERLIRRPLCWVAACAMLGAYVGGRVAFHSGLLLLPLVLILLGLCFLMAGLRRGWAWAFLLLSVGAGALCAASLRATPPALPPAQRTVITGRVATVPSLSEERVTLYLENVTLEDGQRVPGRVWLSYTFGTEGEASPPPLPRIGQSVRTEVRLRLPSGQRNPGGFDFARYLARQGAYMTAYAYDPWEITGDPAWHPVQWMAGLRGALVARIDARYGALAPYVRGMLLGDKESLGEEGRRTIQSAGISHLLAVSGLHVGFLAGPLVWLLRKTKLRPLLRLLLLGGVLGFYCLLVGAPASTVRACVMLMILQSAPLVGRRYDSLSALAAAFLFFLAISPLALEDVGFVLSFSALLGIAFVGNRLQRIRWLRRLPPLLSGLLTVSLGAQLGCLPWVARFFGEVQVLGLLTNLVAVPLAQFVVVLGLPGLLLEALWPPLAAPLTVVAALASQGILVAARWVGAIPFATVRVAAPPLFAILGAFLLMGLWAPAFFPRRPLRWAGTAALCALLPLLLWVRVDRATRYVQLDVGQGDAAVFRQPGYTAVIDTGNPGSGALVDYLRHEGLSVTELFISHPDADHAGALAGLLEAGIPIGRIYLPLGLVEEDFDPVVLLGFLRAQEAGIPIAFLSAGEELSPAQDLRVGVLGPIPGLGRETNDRSLVLALETGGVTLLTTGDAGSQVEPLRGVECEILKVSHHGSNTGTGELFLSYARPEVALISVGAYNTYGHPDTRVLDRLSAVGAEIWRTDQSGALTVTFGDGGYTITPFFP